MRRSPGSSGVKWGKTGQGPQGCQLFPLAAAQGGGLPWDPVSPAAAVHVCSSLSSQQHSASQLQKRNSTGVVEAEALGPLVQRAPWRPEERTAALARPRSGRGSDVKHSYGSVIVLRYWVLDDTAELTTTISHHILPHTHLSLPSFPSRTNHHTVAFRLFFIYCFYYPIHSSPFPQLFFLRWFHRGCIAL